MKVIEWRDDSSSYDHQLSSSWETETHASLLNWSTRRAMLSHSGLLSRVPEKGPPSFPRLQLLHAPHFASATSNSIILNPSLVSHRIKCSTDIPWNFTPAIDYDPKTGITESSSRRFLIGRVVAFPTRELRLWGDTMVAVAPVLAIVVDKREATYSQGSN